MKRAAYKPSDRNLELLGVMTLGVTAFLFLALITIKLPLDAAARLSLDNFDEVGSLLGKPGGAIAYALTLAVGDAAHVIYALTLVWGLMLLSHRPIDRLLTRFVGLFILTGAVAGLLQVNLLSLVDNPQPGGLIGAFFADHLLITYFGIIGSNVIGLTLAMIGILLATDFLFVHILLVIQRGLVQLLRGLIVVGEGLRAVGRGFSARTAERQARFAARQKTLLELKKAEAEIAQAQARHARAEEDDEDEAAYGDETDEAPAPLERIRVQTHTPPQPQELPFEAIAEEEDEAEAELWDTAAQEEEEAFEAASPTSGAFNDERVAAVAEGFDFDEEETPLPANAPALKLPTVTRTAAPASPGGGRSPRPRRKMDVFEELPPDYEYPKRYTRPPLDLLDEAEERYIPNLDAQLRETSVLLEETLQTFGIEARVTDVTRGPTITRFELEPAPGIKVSRFLALGDDIALALRAHRVRVEAPIPGKGRVGIEVPNHERDQVLLRELLESSAFQKGKGKLNLALGKDIAGVVQIADLATMPHLLVAGATGAGKTVCVKALLASLLITHTPDELQLMLIDPKMVELSILNDIPHLITPVVIDPKKAAASLNWLINEMEERYRLFADLRVRNIEVYNKSVENGEIELEGTGEDQNLHSVSVIRKLPYIVCVIDELADLMMLARAEVEDAIARLAQLARAVGIHLIIATQRPSVDVLTGVIKANFPARMSFQVSSRVDSRCILDEIGAERLIGMGDMLYLPAGQSKPHRIQGAFVSDEEMNALIVYLKGQAPPQYRDEIENFGKSKDRLNELLEEDDPLFEDAVQVVLETGQASISMVQRRLRVGYTRAARLIDMMELRGIVGPHTGSKAREILVSASAQEMT